MDDEFENTTKLFVNYYLTLILKRCAFNVFLKVFRAEMLRMSSGSSFHSLADDIVNEFS